ncbi:MAG TPA: glycosyltransferase, partial [Bacteroidetes bacterium]|nr:glycosyltransferase [Bacteroidota bacterium]
LAIFIGTVYFLRILQYYRGLRLLKPGKNLDLHSFSIVVPARNEEKNIGKCLNSLLQQDYHRELYTIHVVDDHSEDGTRSVVEAFAERYPRRIFLHDLAKRPVGTDAAGQRAYKKAAIEYGIEKSKGELIATIDADCWAQPTWLRMLNRHFEPDVGMVSGFILFAREAERNLFEKIQSLEFLGLVAVGAGSLGIGEPVISNGANLAYRREAFLQVGGFRNIDHLPSGDDDLLMQKIHRLTDWRIEFSVEPGSFNFTRPEPSLRAFLNQRTRWASKSTHYRNPLLVLFLFMVYLFYLYLFLGVPVSLAKGLAYPWPLVLLAGKWGVEFLFMRRAAKMVGRTDLLRFFPAAELFQVPYILWVGFWGVFGRYRWKGRLNQNRPGLMPDRKRRQPEEVSG